MHEFNYSLNVQDKLTNHNFLGTFLKNSDGSQALNVKVYLKCHSSLPC